MGVPFPASGTPGDTGLNGVDCHGGTNDNKQTNKTVKETGTDSPSDASLPKGVNQYGGASN